MKAFVVRKAHVCFDVEVEGVSRAAAARGAPGRLVTHDRVLTAEGGASGALHRHLVAKTIACVWMKQKQKTQNRNRKLRSYIFKLSHNYTKLSFFGVVYCILAILCT